jgi:hypothetical protein
VSGYDPGAPQRIEWRDTPYIWVGTVVLNDYGQDFIVIEGGRHSLLVRDKDGKVHAMYGPKFRCRVNER